MKAIIAVHSDGVRHLLFVVAEAFDTQAWAETRRKAFALLGVVKIVEEYV